MKNNKNNKNKPEIYSLAYAPFGAGGDQTGATVVIAWDRTTGVYARGVSLYSPAEWDQGVPFDPEKGKGIALARALKALGTKKNADPLIEPILNRKTGFKYVRDIAIEFKDEWDSFNSTKIDFKSEYDIDLTDQESEMVCVVEWAFSLDPTKTVSFK